MQICPQCVSSNIEGILFCEECGEALYQQHSTVLPNSASSDINYTSSSSSYLNLFQNPRVSAIVVWVVHLSTSITIPVKDEMLLGRGDEVQGYIPEFDLNNFGAEQYGVSRHHAAFYHNNGIITVGDLGSTNGTYLNERKLLPHRPWILHDGDEICLGRLMLQIRFQTVSH